MICLGDPDMGYLLLRRRGGEAGVRWRHLGEPQVVCLWGQAGVLDGPRILSVLIDLVHSLSFLP